MINFNGSTGFRKPCDEQLFNFGLGFGVVFMVTSSKKEIEKLRELQKQTERLVKILKKRLVEETSLMIPLKLYKTVRICFQNITMQKEKLKATGKRTFLGKTQELL